MITKIDIKNNETWYLSDEADILLLPGFSYCKKECYYSENTDELYKEFKAKFPSADIKLYDSDDVVYEIKHSSDIVLTLMEISISFIISMGAGIVADFIYDHIKSKIRIGEEKETHVQVELIIKNKDDKTVIQFDGTLCDIDELIDSIKTLK